MTRPRRRLLALALPLILVPEGAYFLGSLAARPPEGKGSCGVLILGFPTRNDGTPHAVQRHRTKAGVEAFRSHGCERLVISGGAAHSEHIEAETMAALAIEAGVPSSAIVLEKDAHSTWENIRYSTKHLESYGRIIVVSDSLHVHRARRYLCRQRPDLCAKTFTVGAYSPLRMFFLKWAGAANELFAFIRDAIRY